jgi:hypothetical protein
MYLHIYIVTRYIAFRLSVLAAPQPAARHYVAPAHKVAAASDLVNLVKKTTPQCTSSDAHAGGRCARRLSLLSSKWREFDLWDKFGAGV